MDALLGRFGRDRAPTTWRVVTLSVESAFFPVIALVAWLIMGEDFDTDALWISLLLGCLWWLSGARTTVWRWRDSRELEVRIWENRLEFDVPGSGRPVVFERSEVINVSVFGRADWFSMVNPGHVAQGPLPRVIVRHREGTWESPQLHLWNSSSDRMGRELDEWTR